MTRSVGELGWGAGLQDADRAAADRVVAQLAGAGPPGVAFSGGVDSATQLALAARTLGPARVLVILGVSPSLAAEERVATTGVDVGHRPVWPSAAAGA